MAELIAQVNAEKKLHVHMNTQLADVDGFVGNFKTVIKNGDGETTIDHGVAVVATGASELKPTEYSYGDDPRIMTSLELDQKILSDDPMLNGVKSAVFIQCVGSREPERPYCSRVCCTHSIESALTIKKRTPDANVYILYRDIRNLWRAGKPSTKKPAGPGSFSSAYDLENKPQVVRDGDRLAVRVTDHVLGPAHGNHHGYVDLGIGHRAPCR